MQVTQADSSKRKRDGVEDFTNQPTLNTNKMKKFIKSKIDSNETTNRATPTVVTPDPVPPSMGKQERVKPEVQPPLPLDPPPPDKPPNMNLTLKEEIEDVEYNSPGEDSSDAINTAELTDYKSNETEETDKSKIMCRDFIRGKCMRPGTCRFSHKCDVSQLDGIFTFCRNFQNSVCSRPNCKYVHATVFEEQHFYRTGELPPHALAHHKQVNILPPPPPPPEEPPTDMQPIFKSPPPPLPMTIPLSVDKPAGISCIPASKMESRPFPEDLRAALSAANTSPMKREWANIENFGSSPRDAEHDQERLPKRCRNCECVELRLELIKDKYEKMKKAKLEACQKMELLAKKRERLYTTLMTLRRPTYQTKLPGTTLSSTPNVPADSQKWLLDQLNNAMSNNFMAGIQEDIDRNSINGNLSNLVVKLLNVYQQNMLSSDASRKS